LLLLLIIKKIAVILLTKMGVMRGHQTSPDFCRWQNCSPPWAPITHAILLQIIVEKKFCTKLYESSGEIN